MRTNTRTPGVSNAHSDHRRSHPGSRLGSADAGSAALAGPDAVDEANGYELLDAGGGERLEQWGEFRLRRPDPRASGMVRCYAARDWNAADAWYRGEAGRGQWEVRKKSAIPEQWNMALDGLRFVIRLAPFKHTGLFPEQAQQWRWMRDAARAGVFGGESRTGRTLRVLNLFAHTGGATIALTRAGHLVTHVDASKPAMSWARENARANGFSADAIRWIEDDVPTFVKRELRRGRQYDAVLLDPPAFGRAPKGTAKAHAIWRVGDDLLPLLEDILSLLVDPVFVVINDYARDSDVDAVAATLGALLRSNDVESGRLYLQTRDGRDLDTGGYVRWRRRA